MLLSWDRDIFFGNPADDEPELDTTETDEDRELIAQYIAHDVQAVRVYFESDEDDDIWDDEEDYDDDYIYEYEDDEEDDGY